jgi:putative transposase
MGLARSTFYDEPMPQPIEEARLIERIGEVCAEWPAYGYRRITAELHAEGRIVNHKKVMRIMKENGLSVRPRRRFVATTDSDHDGPIFPNLAQGCPGNESLLRSGMPGQSGTKPVLSGCRDSERAGHALRR